MHAQNQVQQRVVSEETAEVVSKEPAKEGTLCL